MLVRARFRRCRCHRRHRRRFHHRRREAGCASIGGGAGESARERAGYDTSQFPSKLARVQTRGQPCFVRFLGLTAEFHAMSADERIRNGEISFATMCGCDSRIAQRKS